MWHNAVERGFSVTPHFTHALITQKHMTGLCGLLRDMSCFFFDYFKLYLYPVPILNHSLKAGSIKNNGVELKIMKDT
jgi:hypothetical protein